MPTQRDKYQTQWAAQFFAAAELTRRGYLAALTLGSAPATDLLVQSPGGHHLTIDVKGLASPNWWFVSERPDHPDYYLLVLVPREGHPTFHILSGTEMALEMQAVKDRAIAAGASWTGRGSGIPFAAGEKHRDRWDVLPE